MGLHRIIRVRALCDGCAHDWIAHLDSEPVFESQQAALAELAGLYGWSITESGMWCDQCTAEHACAEQGHQWDRTEEPPWRYDPVREEWAPNYQVCNRCAYEIPVALARGVGHPERQPGLLTPDEQAALAVLQCQLTPHGGEPR
ncbi:hypothetical protein [Halostreptopolyspora alba]|uniref:Uncharacterized protein n=1 Tax=Halostreptopolyspora alba TaxID=2487137 RepID=A0A3N0E6W7_9ACTN|nr:hypothetical protein EFW17_15070 [Nocardiopsaceae bacterium YIM 96095]